MSITQKNITFSKINTTDMALVQVLERCVKDNLLNKKEI